MNRQQQLSLAESAVRRTRPELTGTEFNEAVQDVLYDWQCDAQHGPECEPYDSPCIEDGVHNCNDWGTGEGRYHGRM